MDKHQGTWDECNKDKKKIGPKIEALEELNKGNLNELPINKLQDMIAESEDLQDTVNEDNKLLDEILAWANKRREKLADADTQDIAGRR